MKFYSNSELNEVQLASIITFYTEMFVKCMDHINSFSAKDLMRAYTENLDILDFLDAQENFKEYCDETLLALDVYIPKAREFCANMETIFKEGIDAQMIYLDVDSDLDEESKRELSELENGQPEQNKTDC